MNPHDDPISQLLARFGRVTAARWWVLAILRDAPHPLTPDEVFAATAAATTRHPDRVTVYRTLEWLVAQGLARRIAASDRAARFEAAGDEPAHAHFLCTHCGQAWCLPSHATTCPPLPDDFVAEELELVVRGRCAQCRTAP